ncbi:hypothetical protein LUM37_14340 [Bacillus subtilis]|nr:hypothetical protein LUM37_14340 [Bacillus subtilis]
MNDCKIKNPYKGFLFYNHVSFVRYEVGEGIEKRQENFAEEVMNQVKK